MNIHPVLNIAFILLLGSIAMLWDKVKLPRPRKARAIGSPDYGTVLVNDRMYGFYSAKDDVLSVSLGDGSNPWDGVVLEYSNDPEGRALMLHEAEKDL